MFYRFEVIQVPYGHWHGVFQVVTPDLRRKLGRTIAVPRWYKNNPLTSSRAWFTDDGYKKYGKFFTEVLEEFISERKNFLYRIKKEEMLQGPIVSKGKIQVIELTEKGEKSMDIDRLAEICEARDVLCDFCENYDHCEKCQITLLVDQAYVDYENEKE